MIQCIFNFGYLDDVDGSGIANLVPYTAYFKSDREMTNWLRNQMQDIYDIASEGMFPKSAMSLFMKIVIDYGDKYYERDFTVRSKKVREYNTILRKCLKKS